jgi:uncharacterized protein (DUF1800 family)
MKCSFLKLWSLFLSLTLACAVPQLLAGKKKDKADPGLNEQRRAVHALNRLTFGPRPGDVQQVMTMGVDRWIDLQLHPEKISDSTLDSRLSGLRIPRMSPKEIAEEFPDNGLVKQVMDGKRPMPSDPARRAIYRVQIARLEERRVRKERKELAPPVSGAAMPSASEGAKTAEELAAAASANPDAAPGMTAENSMNPITAGSSESPSVGSGTTEAGSATLMEAKATPADDSEAKRREERLYADLKVQGLLSLSPEDRFKKVLAMSPDEQLAFADSLRGGQGQEFVADMNPKQKEILLAMNNPHALVVDELSEAKLLRAIYSERQLEEVMTDFWMNHFNVFINKGPERYFLAEYEQRVIRPHALGKFEDLLVATAKSPAMLFYLDNWLSVGPNSMQALGVPARPGRYGRYGRPRMYPRPNTNGKRKQNSGLNENYGRELLELHTLSVNGGYSQRDVTEVAKVFTGWTIEKPNDGGEFRFDPRKHEPGPKFVLGHRIKPKGEDEGREVLHMLATSPQTAHFISLKLAQRFVSDDPPTALVDRMAKTFEKKKGDIREVLSTLFHSPEFWSDNTYRAKLKTPLEFVASAVRATGTEVDDALPLLRQLNNMGMPLYGAQPPTGYPMRADAWVSSSALLNRMNFALNFTSGKMRGLKMDATQLSGSPAGSDVATTVLALEAKLLESDVSKQTHDSIVAQIESPPTPQNGKAQPKPPDASVITGLLLGSPEFQRR